MKLSYLDEEIDLKKANSINIVKREYYAHRDQHLFLFKIDLGKLTKSKEKAYSYVGMFPDYFEISKVKRVIDYLADKRKNSDDVVIPIEKYSDLFRYLDYKHDENVDMSYQDWKKLYETV